MIERFIALTCFVMLPMTSCWAQNLVVGMTEDFRPYVFKEDGHWQGIDIEIGTEVYRRLGFKADFVPLPWPRQLAFAENGQIDAILTVYCNDNRAFLTNSESPLYQVSISLFAPSTFDGNFDTLDQVPSGSIIGAVRGNYFTHFITNNNRFEVSLAKDSFLLVSQLLKKRVHFALEEAFPAMNYAKRIAPNQSIKKVLTLQNDDVCMALTKRFAQNDPSVMSRLNDTISQLKQEGFIEQIIEKYIQ